MMTSDFEYAYLLQLLEAVEISAGTVIGDSSGSGGGTKAVAPNAREGRLEWKDDDEEREGGGNDDCPICREKVPTAKMFVLGGCSHRFCRDCLSQYVKAQMKAKQLPVCCFQECSQQLDLDQCKPFLDPGTVESFGKCLAEASIPESQKIYCPFPDCSALMSRDESLVPVREERLTPTEGECMECHRLFCMQCRVPWHSGMSCAEYEDLAPEERNAEDAQLHRLARQRKWQRCKKCQSVISLRDGCYHITCRCGHEFCYICGAEWRNKAATCKCNLWDENNMTF